jgi:hypothetical protein
VPFSPVEAVAGAGDAGLRLRFADPYHALAGVRLIHDARMPAHRLDFARTADGWGHDGPHDWPSWRAQVAHHRPRFC